MSQPPRNAASLIAMRRARNVPEHPVLVSLIGNLRHANLTLHADAGKPYDWRCIAGLNVEVFASSKVKFSDLLATLAALAAAVPRHMVLTFVEGPRVECGEMRTVTDFALFDWFPIAIGPTAYAEGTKLAKALWSELGHALPIPYDEAIPLVIEIARSQQKCA